MKKWQLVGTTVLGASVLLGACGGGDSSGSGSGDGKDLKGEAKGEGSSTVAPIVEKLNEKWAKDHPNATISSGQAGTGAGFEKFIAGETDFSQASRPIKDKEKQKLEDKDIKYVNSSWPDKKIKAFSPNSSHGTYDFFEEEVMDKEDIKAEKNGDTNVIVQSVEKNKEGIGYFGYNFYEQNKDKLKEVKIKDDKGKTTEPTKTIKDGSYALSRPLFLYVKEKSLKDNDVMREFIKFTLEDKGKSAEDAGYVASPDKTYKDELKDLKKYDKKSD